MAPPVVLKTEVHCDGCARKIERAAKKVPGVKLAMASVNSGEVVVEGTTVDAVALNAQIEAKLKRPVVVVRTGGATEPQQSAPPAAGAPQESTQAPPQAPSTAPAPPPNNVAPPAAPPPQQAPPQYGYNPHYTPSYFSDDNPNNCSIQ